MYLSFKLETKRHLYLYYWRDAFSAWSCSTCVYKVKCHSTEYHDGVKVVGAKIGFILLSLLLVWCDDKIMMSVISPHEDIEKFDPKFGRIRDDHGTGSYAHVFLLRNLDTGDTILVYAVWQMASSIGSVSTNIFLLTAYIVL